MKKFWLGSLVWLAAIPTFGQLPQVVKPFAVSEVRLTDSPFKHAEDLDICYLLALNPDRLLAPYLKEAGLSPKAENYPNWENTGLDGHVGGHYLSALSYMYAATGNAEIKTRLDYYLSELKRCQDAAGDGYLCGVPGGRAMWQDIAAGKIAAGAFDLNKKWVPLYNIHKIYAGLRDAYLIAGSEDAKEMLVKLTDWMIGVVSKLSDEQIQDMLRSEHGGLNETFADVAAITGDKRYLKLAHQFSHDIVLLPLLKHEDVLTGMHANTQIPKVIGFKRIADIEGNQDWSEAARFFWETVVDNRSISIGGNSTYEHFHPANDFSSMINSEQGPETCNTYNMLRLTKMLYQTSGESDYMDYYERALYNHILSTQDPVQGGFVYFTPMRSGHYRVYSQPQTSFWCCVGSGMENHARYGEMIYASRPGELLVNLFIPSTLEWKEEGVSFTQQNRFPQEESTSLIVHASKPKKLTVSFRYPAWAAQAEPQVKVNGEVVKSDLKDGYVSIKRTWKDGDKVELALPMKLRVMQLPDKSPYYSFLYGPIVLAAEMGKDRQDGLFADDSRGGHIAAGPRMPLQQMPMVVGSPEEILDHLTPVEGEPLNFTLKGVSPEQYEGMRLKPFYQLYECRYMVYWEVVSPEELQHRQAELQRQEKERAALDAMTADKVICGEQQPESDHFIRMERSNTGNDNGVHWRETEASFSYRMKANGKAVTAVRISLLPDNTRDAKVVVNGKEIGVLKGTESVQVLELPDALQHETEWTVLIAKAGSPVTLRITEVRLVKP
ncbi:glycoside hydrolase family 127 protein [uncultured Bacteroides sp.]|uniref:glycoside hydrolase family 127 protein n=1 Tax=uncultured Bacteroides sp. TaxID=162156 RepID=UPI002613F3CF|nr:glycoside hydrolase family 127 protein [uncultured Bacteroides sp.]